MTTPQELPDPMKSQFAALGTLALALAPLGAIPLAISHPTPPAIETPRAASGPNLATAARPSEPRATAALT
jgi:hypothetical protein